MKSIFVFIAPYEEMAVMAEEKIRKTYGVFFQTSTMMTDANAVLLEEIHSDVGRCIISSR